MVVETKTVELRVLTADEGMVLTNGEALSSVGGKVYLGAGDSPENWWEISEAEAEEIYKKQEEQIQKLSEE